MQGLTVHLQSEFSVGRWSGDDVFGLADPILAVVSRISMRHYLAVNNISNVRADGLLSFAKHLRDLPTPPEAFSYVATPATVSSDIFEDRLQQTAAFQAMQKGVESSRPDAIPVMRQFLHHRKAEDGLLRRMYEYMNPYQPEKEFSLVTGHNQIYLCLTRIESR